MMLCIVSGGKHSGTPSKAGLASRSLSSAPDSVCSDHLKFSKILYISQMLSSIFFTLKLLRKLKLMSSIVEAETFQVDATSEYL